MSYKTRPTGDFLKTGKVGKSAFEFVKHYSPYSPYFHVKHTRLYYK